MTSSAMPALTIWQPYVSLIAAGAKTHEVRRWAPAARLAGARIAIHAGRRRVRVGDFADPDAVAVALGLEDWTETLPLAAVVCTVRLRDWFEIRSTRSDKVITRLGDKDGPDLPREPWGEYPRGHFVWRLDRIERFAAPIAATGQRGWWDWVGPEV